MNESQQPSRRTFLKRSAASAAAASMAGSLSVGRSAHAASSDELKVAIIGCGGRGTGAVDNCLKSVDNVKLIAVADAFEDRAQRCANHARGKFKDKVDLPDERIFVGFDAYQKAIDSGADVVLMATPPGFRPIHYKAAIEAGKHVFMEKPCCVDAPGYRTLLEANKMADEKNLKVVVGLQRRHSQSYIEGVKRIQDGEIGDFMFSRVYWNSGGVWVRGRQPNQTEMEYQMQNWYYFVWLCGDHIAEQHVHNMDISNWVKGAHPVEANGMGGRQVRTQKDTGQIYDHFFTEFTYADGTKMYSQCRHIRGCWNSASETFHGTKGVSGARSGRDRKNPYDQEHIDLFDAIRNDTACNEGWYGADSSFTAVLGRMACYSGQIVKWDDAVAKGPSEMPEKFAWDADPPVLPDENGMYDHAVPQPGTYKPY